LVYGALSQNFSSRLILKAKTNFSCWYDYTGESQILHEDDFSVKVYPGVDYAFIVALIVVLNEEDMV
jgi:hypothetical protein